MKLFFLLFTGSLAADIDGNWSNWSDPGDCITGLSKRLRTCTNPAPAGDGFNCPGLSYDYVSCVDGGLGDWGAWGTCTDNKSTRTRLCDNPAPLNGGAECDSDELSESVSCQNGGLGDWTRWSSCTNNKRSRNRPCDNPSTMAPGTDCDLNDLSEEQDCVDGNWGLWSNWGSCQSGTYRTKTRTCNNPSPLNGGATCPGMGIETQNCADGNWSNWGNWGGCAGGERQKERTCTNPAPSNGGDTCPGIGTETQNCANGDLGDWGEWSSCTNDKRSRSKPCDNPAPFNGGATCAESFSPDEISEEEDCAKVTVCSNFGSCSKKCDGGVQACSNTCSGGTRGATWGVPGCPTEDEINSKECNLDPCLKSYGLSFQTNLANNEELFDTTSDLFKLEAAKVENKIKSFSFVADLTYIQTVVVKKFVARKTDRKRRSAGTVVDASVEVTVLEKKSLDAAGTSDQVVQKILDEATTAIDNDTDGSSPFGGIPSIDYCNEFGAGNDCPADSTCNRTPSSYFCSCNEGFRMATEPGGQVCKTACDLFSVSCAVSTGFTLTVNGACRAEQYSHLTDLSGLFAQAKDLASAGEDKPAGLDSKCSFTNPDATDFKATFGFDTCGVSAHTVEDDHTYFTTYVNHRVQIGSVVTSQLDQNELKCKLMNVDLETDSDLSANDEKLGADDIDAAKLISDFSLRLVAGLVNGNTFTEIKDGEAVDVGTEVNVKLDFTDNTGNNYQFVLSDCAAVSGADTIDLYENFCPNTASSIVSLDWLKSTQYSLNLFRVKDATSITFKCKASVYPEEASLCNCDTKANCPTGGRRRRAPEGENTAEVTATVNLNDSDDESSATKLVGALGFCAINVGLLN